MFQFQVHSRSAKALHDGHESASLQGNAQAPKRPQGRCRHNQPADGPSNSRRWSKPPCAALPSLNQTIMWTCMLVYPPPTSFCLTHPLTDIIAHGQGSCSSSNHTQHMQVNGRAWSDLSQENTSTLPKCYKLGD